MELPKGYNTIWVRIIVVVVVCTLPFYVLSINSKISYSKENGFSLTPRLTDGLQTKILDLKATTVSKSSHEQITKQLKYMQETTISIQELPVEFRGGGKPQAALDAIRAGSDELRGLHDNVFVSYTLVSVEITTNGPINTKMAAMDARRQRLYSHIQKCLCSIGAYCGKMDGEQTSTYSAIIDFQVKYGLQVDGIIGQKTWAKISQEFDQIKLE